MLSQNHPPISKTQNPLFSLLTPSPNPLRKFLLQSPIFPPNSPIRFSITAAGRSKKKSPSQSSGRIEGNAEFRREVKRSARRKSQKLAESAFYRLNNPRGNYPDKFTEDELQEIGLGYDRMVRFMEKDDPNIRHPHDWYKYGEFGPYTWKGVVVGDPVRGRFSDERVSMVSQVRDEEEWDEIERFEMSQEYGKRVGQLKIKGLDRNVGVRYYWVFVRHPKWRLSDSPWEQWTLVSEVAVEAERRKRLDKWSLMGRFGNLTRSLITRCAAWFRPDVVYVKRPVYQCRFEPQDDFFQVLVPFLDPRTEGEYLFEVEREDGSVDMSSYFGGLCKIVRVSPKAYVDDVVKGYERLSDEGKSRCLGFLLRNHPVQLLHPWTREWKAKLEELELGCDAPEDDEAEPGVNVVDKEFTDWVEIDGDDGSEGENGQDGDEESEVIDMEDGEDDDELGAKDEDMSEEEDVKYWEEELKKATTSGEYMETLARRSVAINDKRYEKQFREMEGDGDEAAMRGKRTDKQMRAMGSVNLEEDGDETAMRGKRAKVSAEEWKRAGYGPWRKRIKRSRIPPELFLRAAVRPFTYKNLVKEIVLTRHAILDGEFGPKH